MSNRATRRAAERQSQKLAANATKAVLAQQAPTETMAAAAGGSDQPPLSLGFAERTEEVKQTSEARLIANRANAQFSTGPRTAGGKAKSSLNAVKTGLTGRTVLLPTDDALIYQQHLDRHFAKYSPANDNEQTLVQTIADTEWRLLRIAPLEAGIYAIGRLKLASQFAEETDPANREALIMAEVFTVYLRQLSNLALQERRLRNQRQTDIAELKQLQKERREKRHSEIQRALKIPTFDPTACGFDFSLVEFRIYNQRNNAQYPITQANLDFDSFLAEYRAAGKEFQAA